MQTLFNYHLPRVVIVYVGGVGNDLVASDVQAVMLSPILFYQYLYFGYEVQKVVLCQLLVRIPEPSPGYNQDVAQINRGSLRAARERPFIWFGRLRGMNYPVGIFHAAAKWQSV